MSTQLIAKITTDITPEETFIAPSLTDASRGIAALILSALATQGSADVPHPKRLRIKMYKAQIDGTKVLEHTVLKLADIEAEFEAEGRFEGIPQYGPDGPEDDTVVEPGPLVTLT